MLKLLLVACCPLLLVGCVFGNVRTREVDALAPYKDMAVRVEMVPPTSLKVPQEVTDEIAAGLQRGLETWNQRRGPGSITPDAVLSVEAEVIDFHAGKA